MGKTLLILRHGKSVQSPDLNVDFDRPLASRGEKAAERIAELLDEEELIPELIVSSPAKRALGTAEIIHASLIHTQFSTDERIYAAGLGDLLAVVQELSDDNSRVMLVGHNPGLEELADELTGRDDTILKTCSLAVLNSAADSWLRVESGSCSLAGLFHPRELED